MVDLPPTLTPHTERVKSLEQFQCFGAALIVEKNYQELLRLATVAVEQ